VEYLVFKEEEEEEDKKQAADEKKPMGDHVAKNTRMKKNDTPKAVSNSTEGKVREEKKEDPKMTKKDPYDDPKNFVVSRKVVQYGVVPNKDWIECTNAATDASRDDRNSITNICCNWKNTPTLHHGSY
jgi:hypothetical protein